MPTAVHHPGENLRRLCGLHDVSQTELAEHLGVSRKAVHEVIAGRNNLTLTRAFQVCELFGITVEDLHADWPTCMRAAAAHAEDAPIEIAHAAAK